LHACSPLQAATYQSFWILKNMRFWRRENKGIPSILEFPCQENGFILTSSESHIFQDAKWPISGRLSCVRTEQAMQQCTFFLFYPRVKTNSETTELVQSADEHSWLARVSCHSESVNVLTIFSIDSRFCRALMSSVRSCCESRWLQILHSAVYHYCYKKHFQFQSR
jgi:hypothetical protein